MGTWVDFPLSGELNKNVNGTMLTANAAEIQNAYLNEAGGLSRFPQLRTFLALPPKFPVYLEDWRNDLMAVAGGRTYRINLAGSYTDVTGASVEGGKRVIFAKTEDELVMTAGRQMVRYRGAPTTILSPDAPETTHVGWVSSYLVALEKDSGRFQHSVGGNYTQWDALNVFSAEGKPDDLTGLLVTEFGELLLAGTDSIEQHDPSPSGDQPFYRRWLLGRGLYAPYSFVSADNRAWGVNDKKEFVAYSTQVGVIASQQIQSKLEEIDDWSDTFAMPIAVAGQRFIVLQMPKATNSYGTKGVTFLYDYRKKHWFEIFGFNDEVGLPERWQGYSYKEIGNRKFIGGNGVIYELEGQGGEFTQKMLWRSGFVTLGGSRFSIEKLQIRVERGKVAVSQTAPVISMRVNKDNRGFGRYVRRDLGKAGKSHMELNFGSMGVATNFQIEIEATDDIGVEISKIRMYVESMDE